MNARRGILGLAAMALVAGSDMMGGGVRHAPKDGTERRMRRNRSAKKAKSKMQKQSRRMNRK